MTAAKIMDVIARFPGCDGQAADAVSAYTEVKLEDVLKQLQIPKSECPDVCRGGKLKILWYLLNECVIVQCVVSLLFLAIQCTHSAIVDARPVARAWNLALRLTSSALGQ